jgi:multidrug efflux pump subunit AcrA (membrane-fusion protein)
MIKGWTKFLISLLLIAVISGVILGYLKYSEELIPIETAEVKFGNVEEIIKMSGYVDSEDTESVISNAEGIIGNLKVEEGDRVKKGGKLCLVRSPELRKRLLEMRAELVTAKQNIKAARTQSAKKFAWTRYNFIKANIADLEETMQPKAHVDADVIKVNVQNGSKIIPGMSLFLLADMQRAVIKAHMDESDVQRVKAGQPVWITGDFLSGRSLQGKVSKISKYVDRENGTFVETTCKIFNPRNLPLKFGAYVDVKVITARRKNVLLIPTEALIIDKIEYVFVVKNEYAYLMPIKVGIIGEKFAEVLFGLEEGATVATVGSLDLSDGDRVHLK